MDDEDPASPTVWPALLKVSANFGPATVTEPGTKETLDDQIGASGMVCVDFPAPLPGRDVI